MTRWRCAAPNQIAQMHPNHLLATDRSSDAAYRQGDAPGRLDAILRETSHGARAARARRKTGGSSLLSTGSTTRIAGTIRRRQYLRRKHSSNH
jgi:hypothetical protein